MSKRSRRSRVYWRAQGGERRAWADFRDLGGKREPLKVPGQKRATTDPKLAEVLCAQRLAHVTRDLAKGALYPGS